MANFNLPFGVFVSKPLVLDASRYVVKNIAERDALIPGRAYNGLQTYVKDNSTLYILKDVSNSIWGIIPDLSTIAISDASKLNNYTDTFYGDLTIDGSILISGNIIQDGSYYVTNVEEITSKNEFITLREDSIAALNDGSISGIRISKADGSTNVVLGAGNDAVMRVGWEGDNLLAIATREDNPTNLGYAYWDDASSMFKTDLLAETVSRTIYVETTGNDITGDGLTVGTAFATIGKALSTVKKTINIGIVVTIQVGIGSFTINEADFGILAAIIGMGSLTIQGTLTLVDSGFTMGTALANDPLTYPVSGGNTAAWTANQWKYHFLKSGANYVPITANEITPTISVSAAGTGTEIYQAQTIVTCPNDIFIGVQLTFSALNLKYNSGVAINYYGYNKLTFTQCLLESLGTSSTFFFSGFSSSINFTRVSLMRCVINTPPAISTFITCYFFLASNAAIISMNNNSLSLSGGVFENTSTSSGASCISLNSRNCYLSTSGSVKFVNTIYPIRFSGTILGTIRIGNIIFLNTSYFLVKSSTTSDYSGNIKVSISGTTYGLPITRWFYDSMYEFININSGRNIQITGIIYPEVEVNQTKNLSNNTTTPIIIGDVSQNISCKVDYTIKRGAGFRAGSFNIISDTSNSYITPDIFGTNFNSAVDASAIYFSTDISNGKYIMMNVTQNNSTDASLFYNVSRVMRTPIIM